MKKMAAKKDVLRNAQTIVHYMYSVHYIKWRKIVDVINLLNFCRFPSIVDVVPGLLGASIR